jgi:hypothetical protein
MNWSKIPPTSKKWLNANNHGAWWIKYKLADKTSEIDGDMITWPEVWLVEIVTIMEEWTSEGKDRLVAYPSTGKSFYLDEVQDIYWQAVKPPDNDIKDQEPK